MKFLLLIFLIPFVAKSQELNVGQTLAYINKQLNDKNNKFYNGNLSVYTNTFIAKDDHSISNVDEWAMNDYSYNIKIEKGSLIIIRTFTKNGSYQDAERNWHTVNYSAIIEESSVPINIVDNNFYSAYQKYVCNNSSPTHPSLFVIDAKDAENNYIIRISKEFDSKGNEIKKKTEKQKYLHIEFSNSNLVCDKLANAFTHLIDLVSKDSGYNNADIVNDNDPFSNPVKKETTNSNSIATINSNSIP